MESEYSLSFAKNIKKTDSSLGDALNYAVSPESRNYPS